jgi:serine/threonine protein kinase
MVNALSPGDPRQVGKYRLLGALGDGGMGRVFLGQSPGGRLVAVKLIRTELAGNPDFRARFAREVATARTVSGIFTAAVVDADTSSPQPWLVTGYVDGPSLATAVAQNGPLPVATVLSLAAGLAEGLGAIHAAGIVHRDLKPSNVLLASDGPRIIDFGISRAADATELTRAGSLAGSPGFMSPEQAEGVEAGPASDIFSLGAVLAFAATGQEPFGTGAATALLYRVVHSPPATGGVPTQLRPLVEGCLAKDPQRRPTTDQILAELGAGHAVADRLPGARPRDENEPSGSGAHWAAAAEAAFPPQTEAARAVSPPVTPSSGPVTITSASVQRGHGSTTWPAQESPAGRRPRPRRPVMIPVVATGVFAGALAVTAVVLASHWRTAAQPARLTGGSHQGQPASTRSAQPSTAPAQSWVTYQDPSGFSIKLPAGWVATSRSREEVDFTGQPPGFVVIVAWSRHPQPDALADWRQQAAAKAQADPTYQQIRVQRVSYRGYNAADWEFINMYQGELTHVLDRTFIVQPGHLAYAIELYGPQAQWAPVQASTWNELMNSFEAPS